MKNILNLLTLLCCSSCLPEEKPAVSRPPDGLLHREIFFLQKKRELDPWYYTPVPYEEPSYFMHPVFFDVSAPYPIVELDMNIKGGLDKKMGKDSS